MAQNETLIFEKHGKLCGMLVKPCWRSRTGGGVEILENDELSTSCERFGSFGREDEDRTVSRIARS
jgi:hypothetical protein